jgi:hypothetical protein
MRSVRWERRGRGSESAEGVEEIQTSDDYVFEDGECRWDIQWHKCPKHVCYLKLLSSVIVCAID